MTATIFALLFLCQNKIEVVRGGPPDNVVERLITAKPDVVMRGQTVRVVLAGSDADSLKTLQIKPPEGIQIAEISPLPSQDPDSAAATVTLKIEANAQTGPRVMVLAVMPRLFSSSPTRATGEGVSKAIDDAFDRLVKVNARIVDAGVLYINSHEVKIGSIAIMPGDPQRVQISVTDPAGDLAAGPATGLVSELQCGKEILDSPLEDATVSLAGGRGSSAVITADLFSLLEKQKGCELRVRVSDSKRNTSPWFVRKVNLQ